MKKTILLIIVALLVGAGTTGVYFYTHGTKESSQPIVQVPEKAKEVQKTKYEVGPPDATEILELVNNERAKVGVKPLVIDEKLVLSAQWKADDMANLNYFGHTRPGEKNNNGLDYLNSLQPGCSYISENIVNPPAGGNSQQAFDKWMDSKPHREAIQDSKYTRTGIGITKAQGNSYDVVQHFCVAK